MVGIRHEETAAECACHDRFTHVDKHEQKHRKSRAKYKNTFASDFSLEFAVGSVPVCSAP